MRSLVFVSLIVLLALPASAGDVLDAPEPVAAYRTTPVEFGIDLAVAALNPSVVVPPGGATMSVRGTDLAASAPQVRSWIHDFDDTATEPVLLGGAFDPQVRGVSADGRRMLVADELGSPHLVDRTTEAITEIGSPDPNTSLVALALSSDGQRAFLQWAAPITSPDERGVGLAIYDAGTVTVLDEPTPIAWSPDLAWYVRAEGTGLALVGPDEVTRIDGLGPPEDIVHAEVTDAAPDGTVTVVAATGHPTVTTGGESCGATPCAEVLRVRVRAGAETLAERLSDAADGSRIDQSISDLAVSPDGSRVAIATAAVLTDGPSGTLENVFVADGRTVRAISLIELDIGGGVTLEGGRNPVFLDGNTVIFYADVDGSATSAAATPAAGSSAPTLGAAEIPAGGLRIATLDPFDDIFGNLHAGAIWWAADEGVTNGCSEAQFCPGLALTRAQAASMLARALGLDPQVEGPFVDVVGTHAGAINALADAAITEGCTADTFCPDVVLTRAQGASLLVRALGLDPVVEGPFVDVAGTHAESINALAAAGITAGCAVDTFCPTEPLTRAQMAALLYRALAG